MEYAKLPSLVQILIITKTNIKITVQSQKSISLRNNYIFKAISITYNYISYLVH